MIVFKMSLSDNDRSIFLEFTDFIAAIFFHLISDSIHLQFVVFSSISDSNWPKNVLTAAIPPHIAGHGH